MDMTGEYRIPAPREKVWEALNDPEVLKKCIPGCQELNKDSETELSAKVKSKVGPVSATFTGKVTLSDINPPEGYKISGEGTGGVAGFAKGGADVKLAEDGDGTILTYTANAQVGGKLAQIGSRLIDSTAKKMANEFFGKFAEEVGGSGAEAEELDADSEDPDPGPSKPAAPAAEAAPAPAAAPASDKPADGPKETPSPEPATAHTTADPDGGPAGGSTPPAGTDRRPGGSSAASTSTESTSAEPAKPAAPPPPPPAEKSGGVSPAVWVGGLVVAAVIVLVLLTM